MTKIESYYLQTTSFTSLLQYYFLFYDIHTNPFLFLAHEFPPINSQSHSAELQNSVPNGSRTPENDVRTAENRSRTKENRSRTKENYSRTKENILRTKEKDFLKKENTEPIKENDSFNKPKNSQIKK